MKYEGRISKLDRIIVSDPSYDKGVWCRYENDNANMSNCKVALNISEYHEVIPADEVARDLPEGMRSQVTKDLELEGIEFQLLISDSRLKCEIVKDGFNHPQWTTIQQFTIGMDSACVALGINEVADKIASERDSWQPSTALTTLTDGEFGTVCEGRTPNGNNTALIYITGSFDKDNGYTEEMLKSYLEAQLQIEDLHPVETEEQTEDLEIGGI